MLPLFSFRSSKCRKGALKLNGTLHQYKVNQQKALSAAWTNMLHFLRVYIVRRHYSYVRALTDFNFNPFNVIARSFVVCGCQDDYKWPRCSNILIWNTKKTREMLCKINTFKIRSKGPRWLGILFRWDCQSNKKKRFSFQQNEFLCENFDCLTAKYKTKYWIDLGRPEGITNANIPRELKLYRDR